MRIVLDESGVVGVVLGLSASTVIAICSAIVAWLKWRHPPNNK
jgi:Flp pilus assembly pilin Flp